MLFDSRPKRKARRNPARKSIFQKVKSALKAAGVETGAIQSLGQWRAVWGKDSNNIASVIPVYGNFISAADLLLIYWPDSKILSGSFWEYGKGGGSEQYRITPGYSYTSDADSSTIREIAKDTREILDMYDEEYTELEDY